MCCAVSLVPVLRRVGLRCAVLLCAWLLSLVLFGVAACSVMPSSSSSMAVSSRGSLRCVLCTLSVLPWCVGVCCCSTVCFGLCVSSDVVLCVPSPPPAVHCCAAPWWCACVVLFVWPVVFLLLGAVVCCRVLCCYLGCAVVRCCAALLGAWCAVMLRAVPCSPASCRVMSRRLLCGAALCSARAPASRPCVVLCCFCCAGRCPVVLYVVSVCSSPGLVARCCFPGACCGLGVPGWSGWRPDVG